MNNANISITSDNSKAIRQTEQLSSAFKTLSTSINGTESGLKQLGNASQSAISQLSSFSQGVYSLIGNLKEFANASKSAFDFLREGADLAEAQENFKAYVTSLGHNADGLVEKFRKATNNQINDVELMKSATKALRVAGIEDVNAIAKLYEIADNKGDLLGKSLQETFDTIVSAISSGNGRSLLQLGLLPESFTKASNSADLLKNKSELLRAVIQQAEGDFKALSSVGETNSDKFNQIEAAFSNVNSEIKKGLTEIFMPAIEFIRTDGVPIIQSLSKSFTDTLIPAVKNISSIIQNSFIEPVSTMLGLFGRWRSESEYIAENMAKLGYAGELGNLEYKKQKLQEDFRKVEKAVEDAVNDNINSIYDRSRYSKNYVGVENASNEDIACYGARYAKQLRKEIDKINEQQQKLINNHKEAIKKQQEELNKPIVFKIKGETSGFNKAQTEIDKTKIKVQSLKDAFKQAFESVKNPEKAAETAIDNFAKSATALNGPFGIMGNVALEAFATIEASAAKINLKDLTSQINRLSESEKELIEYSDKLKAGDYKAMLSFGSAVASGGKLAKEDVKDGIEKTGKSMYEEFSSATANAITDGLLNADFSGFRQNLGSILKSTVSNYLSSTINSVLSGSNAGVLQNATNSIFKQVYTKNSKGGSSLNFGNLLTNVGIGLGVSWLTGEGGLFGKRKIKGGENIDKSNSLNEQVDSAKAIRDELLTAVGITEATRQALENAIFSYTWTTSHKNHNPFHRTKTYYLHGQAEAQASIDYLEQLQQLSQSEQAKRNYQLWNLSRGDTIGSANLSYLDTLSAYEYMTTAKNYNSTQLSQTLYKQKTAQQTIRNIQSQLANAEKARNDYYQKLVEQYTTKTYDRRTRSYTTSVNTKAIDRAMAQYDSQGIYSYQIKQLQNQLTQAQNNLATITAEYNKGNSNKYSEAEIAEAKLAAEEAKQALLTAQQSERTTFTSNFLNNSTLAGLYGNNASVISKLLGNDYSKFDTTSSIQQMLPMLETAGLKDYDWQKRLSEAGTDTQKQIAVYQEQQSILESALKTYESIMKDNKEEALNTRLSVEEQQSAFERWQEAFNQVLAIQQEIADNTNTIAELEKSKYADTLADQLSDVMTVVAEAVRQTNGKETVIYYQNATGKEILAKLKAAIQNGNVANADDLLTAINETEQLEIWG